MMNEYPPQDATMQKQDNAEPTDHRIEPVLHAFMNTQNEKTNAKMATPSLSQEPATERDM